MRSFETWLVALSGAALLTCVAPEALAAGAEADAKTLFAKGRELRLSGKCEDAILAFRRALEVYPEGLGALRNIAECEEQMGLYASARRDWWDLRRAALQSNEARYAGWAEDAEARYRALGEKVGTLTIALRGAEGNEKVSVRMDGKPIDPRLLGVELERDPGAHTIEVFYGGAAPLAERIELAPGEHRVVTLALPAAAPARDARVAPSTPSTPPTTANEGPSGARIGAYVALGVGGASAVATVVAVAVRAGALSAVEEGCTRAGDGYVCPPALEGDSRTGATASTLATVFAGAAIAGLGAGITLLALSPAKSARQGTTEATRAELSVSPWVGGVGSRFLVRF